MNKYLPYVLFLLISILVVVLSINDFGPMTSLQRSLDDLLCRITATEGIRPNVVLVTIDSKAQQKHGDWPWTYDLIADLTAAVATGEPKVLVVDLELIEDAAQNEAGHTNVLANQLTWIDQAVLTYDIALSTFRSGKTDNPEFLFNNSITVSNPMGIMDENANLLVRKVFLPAERLLTHKPRLGFKYHRPDQDRILRHQPLTMTYEGFCYPSASLMAAMTYLGVSPNQVMVEEGKQIHLGSSRTIPINKNGEFFINFTTGNPFTVYSAAEILSEGFNLSVLKNKAVIIGLAENIGNESYPSAVRGVTSELIAKATVIENLINNNILEVKSDLAGFNLLILFLLGGVFAFSLPRVNTMYRMVILGGGLIVLMNVNYLLFSSYRVAVPTVYILLELVLFMLASPLLDMQLFGSEEAVAEKKPKSETKTFKARAAKLQLDSAPPPVREIKATNSDQENLETCALGATPRSKADSISNADHQTINIDDAELDPGGTMASDTADKPTSTESPALAAKSEGLAHQETPATGNDPLFKTPTFSANDSPGTDSQNLLMGRSDDELTKLGRYQVTGILGKGAMGSVYLGVDPAINRPVALKTIRLDFVNDPAELDELRERLHREGQAAGKLSHPAIVTIYDVGSEGSLQYIAMEYIEGQTLEDLIKKKVRFNYRIIAQIITQICSALDYAHERGIVHRDIKPANIMAMKDYRIKVMDFGIARIDSNSMTKTGIAMGTPNYISPEQLKGQEIDRRADIFSLGVVMYEMLLGRRPFKGENITSLMYSILNHTPEKPSSINPQVPLLFDHIVARALEKDPARRYQKATEITADLQDFVESFAH